MSLMTRWDIPPVSIGKSVVSGLGVLFGPWPRSLFCFAVVSRWRNANLPGDLRVVGFAVFFVVVVIVCGDLPFF